MRPPGRGVAPTLALELAVDPHATPIVPVMIRVSDDDCAARPHTATTINTAGTDHGVSVWCGGNQSKKRDQSQRKKFHVFFSRQIRGSWEMNTSNEP